MTAAYEATNARSPRSPWAARYANVRARTLELTRPLNAEDQLLQSMPDVSPTKWHLAHTTWFFETFILAEHVSGYTPFDPAFGYLFNSYYEAAGPRHPRPERGLISRPTLDEVHAYRGHIDTAMTALIGSAGQSTWRALAPLIELGLNHEQQHQELILMDIKHVLAQNPLSPAYHKVIAPSAEAAPLSWSEYPGGIYEIGHEGAGFAYDNEGPRHKVWLEPFKLADRLVTNSEYAAFIADGGYTRAEFWLSDGWTLINQEQWRAPFYWRGEPGAWREFTLSGERALDKHQPVLHLSYFEADAYAHWAGKRLPREAEWEIAAVQASLEHERTVESASLHPQAARQTALAQMFGAAWQWTQSAYSAYPRYRPPAGAIGEYNGKFMCGQFVLRGSAAITPAGHSRITYRNFFPPSARWAFSGLRLADDI